MVLILKHHDKIHALYAGRYWGTPTRGTWSRWAIDRAHAQPFSSRCAAAAKAARLGAGPFQNGDEGRRDVRVFLLVCKRSVAPMARGVFVRRISLRTIGAVAAARRASVPAIVEDPAPAGSTSRFWWGFEEWRGRASFKVWRVRPIVCPTTPSDSRSRTS